MDMANTEVDQLHQVTGQPYGVAFWPHDKNPAYDWIIPVVHVGFDSEGEAHAYGDEVGVNIDRDWCVVKFRNRTHAELEIAHTLRTPDVKATLKVSSLKTEFSCNEWLAAQDRDEIAEIIREGFTDCEITDQIALFYSDLTCEAGDSVRCAFNYREALADTFNQSVPFTLAIDQESMTKWIKQHRPNIWESLLDDEDVPVYREAHHA